VAEKHENKLPCCILDYLRDLVDKVR